MEAVAGKRFENSTSSMLYLQQVLMQQSHQRKHKVILSGVTTRSKINRTNYTR